ncbi:hypothetical protein IID19_02495 [Patescibacteria group bacterium]|nr:hypothetical protein [Patescibacteria group bacterium]
MYVLLSLAVAVAVAVADFLLLTNFKALVLMVGGTLFAFLIHYGVSKAAIYDTAPKHLKRLMRQRVWYEAALEFVKYELIIVIVLIAGILFLWYVPRDYSMNMAGVAGSIVVLMLSSFAAHLCGTLRGMQVVLSGKA